MKADGKRAAGTVSVELASARSAFVQSSEAQKHQRDLQAQVNKGSVRAPAMFGTEFGVCLERREFLSL